MSILDRPLLPGEPHPGIAIVPPEGTYMTNGATLYRVERHLTDSTGEEALLELEDCATLELVLCPARPAAVLGLRLVFPRVDDDALVEEAAVAGGLAPV
jgi:hypothetical protein